MQIERLSIKLVTVSIFLMISVAAIILSMLAGSYFRQSALDAQMHSLSRVIEVASEQMLKEVRKDTFNLGMSFTQNADLARELKNIKHTQETAPLVELLDDPFINGFVGISKITLEKIRLYDASLNFVFESTLGIKNLEQQLPAHLKQQLTRRRGIERLKSIDALWLSPAGPLYSTVVPVGGLDLQGYLEIIIDPSPNLPDIGDITKTPISIYTASGELVREDVPADIMKHLPVRFPILTSDGKPAFRIVGYENVEELVTEMDRTQIVTTVYFLILILVVLLFALWLFHRYLFLPAEHLVADMKNMAEGKRGVDTNKKGLLEFYTLATTFDDMCNQIKAKTQALTISQNRLLRLLDLNENAILYFGFDNEVVYANKGACELFGHLSEEMGDLYLFDLFGDDVEQTLLDYIPVDSSVHREFQTRLQCIQKSGKSFQCDAVISTLNASGEAGYAIALSSIGHNKNTVGNGESVIDIAGQRMEAVEQSLNSLLEIAKNNPMLLGVHNNGSLVSVDIEKDDKATLRDLTLQVMHAALACWEQDLKKSKLQLAEESGIWPVYMDKSTPTTRTLDKYLHTDSCPRNPRYQRVIDTAEYVLDQMRDQSTAHRTKLKDALQQLRLFVSGQDE